MQKKTWIFILVLIIIGGTIFYLEQQKATPIFSESTPGSIQTEDQMMSAPELVGLTGFLNNAPESIQISDFKGKVVLIDFWTYTCINCIRTLPHLTNWHDKYSDQGLVIIGVHTPEFEYEKEAENVQSAIEQYEIEYLVVQDNNYATWQAFRNRFWPRKYLIDAEGKIRYDHIGEGAYDETEEQIQLLLEEAGQEIDEEISDIPDQTPILGTSPELYAGHGFALPRNQNLGNLEGFQTNSIFKYDLPEQIIRDRIYLGGSWFSHEEYLKSEPDSNNPTSEIVLLFLGNDVNIVADSIDNTISELDVIIDGQYVNELQAGSDVIIDPESGRSYIKIDKPRLYNVIDGTYGSFQLRLSTESDNFFFSAFTFG